MVVCSAWDVPCPTCGAKAHQACSETPPRGAYRFHASRDEVVFADAAACLEIQALDASHTVLPLAGQDCSLAVLDVNGRVLGHISVARLGYRNVDAWRKAQAEFARGRRTS